MKRFIFLLVGAFLFGCYRFPVAVAQVPDNEEGGKAFVRLQDATQKIRAARFSDYEGRLGVRVDAKAFEEMQKYLLERYEGVETVNSFVRDNTYVDCIKTDSQPSVRQQGIREIAKPPLSSEVEAGRRRAEPGQNRYAESPLKLGLKDRFGNPVACPEGTIPMQRITLDMLVRYRTLRDFFAKVPRGRGVPTPPRKTRNFAPIGKARTYMLTATNTSPTTAEIPGSTYGIQAEISRFPSNGTSVAREPILRRLRAGGKCCPTSTVPTNPYFLFIGRRTTIRTRVAITSTVRDSSKPIRTGTLAELGITIAPLAEANGVSSCSGSCTRVTGGCF